MELESVKAANLQLNEENSALQMSNKSSMSESQSLMAEMQMIKDTGRGIVSNVAYYVIPNNFYGGGSSG